MFSFLYRVFYDRTLFSSYIKRGKGLGGTPLFVLTLFAAFCVALRLFWLLFSFSMQPIDEFVSKVPRIVFEKGVITFPENERFSFLFNNDRFFFVFDTTKNPVSLKDLPSTGFYVTSDAIVTVRGNERHRIPFVKVFEKTDVSLDEKRLRTEITQTVSILKVLLPPLMFLFCMPGMFCAYFFLMLMLGAFSFFMTQAIKMPLSFAARMRLAALSVMPASIINMAGLISGANFHFGMFGLLIALIYMYCFLKDGQIADKN
ncbi:MAG: DUF1189 family protein [Alphaproteobacteria bacterium]|nr:DUF1189 family protein [Alphaproteobacteria bacterium]